MIKLRLAEYKDGKFKRFLELGRDFLYGGDVIQLTETPVGTMRLDQFVNMAARFTATDSDAERWAKWATECLIKKDEKDPLSRFDGRFDGRTYGNGRFVLIRGYDDAETRWEDSVFSLEDNSPPITMHADILTVGDFGNHYGAYPEAFDFPRMSDSCNSGACSFNLENRLLGNIHENPELWDLINQESDDDNFFDMSENF